MPQAITNISTDTPYKKWGKLLEEFILSENLSIDDIVAQYSSFKKEAIINEKNPPLNNINKGDLNRWMKGSQDHNEPTRLILYKAIKLDNDDKIKKFEESLAPTPKQPEIKAELTLSSQKKFF